MKQKAEVRCLNCFVRIEVPPGAQKLTCPNCKVEYVIHWIGKLGSEEQQAKIMGLAK